jgi:hypothetical protein
VNDWNRTPEQLVRFADSLACLTAHHIPEIVSRLTITVSAEEHLALIGWARELNPKVGLILGLQMRGFPVVQETPIQREARMGQRLPQSTVAIPRV